MSPTVSSSLSAGRTTETDWPVRCLAARTWWSGRSATDQERLRSQRSTSCSTVGGSSLFVSVVSLYGRLSQLSWPSVTVLNNADDHRMSGVTTAHNRIQLIQRGRGIRPDEAPATLQPVLVDQRRSIQYRSNPC